MRIIGLSSVVIISLSLLFGCSSNDQSNPTDTKAKQKESVSSKPKMEEVTKAYSEFAISEIDQFVKATEEFTNAVKNGEIEKAKEIYPTARMFYERSEPIAESFGDLDPKIDAREGDVKEEEWTGYHRIEKGLWEENTTKGYEKYADQLLKDAKLLRAKVETVDVTPDVLVTGAVDLLNEVSTSKVTGEEDRYSHTDLYDFAANVQGAEKIYHLLKDELEKKDKNLSEKIGGYFDEVNQLLEKHKKDGKYILYTELKKSEVKQLSQAIDALAEPLSQLGIVLEG